MPTVLIVADESGADATTVFDDRSDEAHPVSTHGNAQWDTDSAPTGQTASLRLDGTGDTLSCSTGTYFAMGTGDFTAEGFAQQLTSTGTQVLVACRQGGGAGFQLATSSDRFYWFEGVTGQAKITTTRFALSTWVHFAVARGSNSTRLFIDGTQVGATYVSSDSLQTINVGCYIGSDRTSTNFFNGRLASIRITKAEALYTANFTPPSLPLFSTTGPTITSEWLYPTAQTIEAGGGTWTNSSNIFANDALDAALTWTSKNSTAAYNVGQHFGFDSVIPLGATIDKVDVRAKWRVTTAGGIATLTMAAFVGGTSTGVALDNSTEPTTMTTNTFDITADRAWTRDDLLNSTFELKVTGRNGNSSNDPFYRFDYIAARVVYTVSSASDAIRIIIPAGLEGQGVRGIFYGNRIS